MAEPRYAASPDDYPMVSIAETDKPLPRKLDTRTRYAYFKTIARGGRSIIQSCKDLHLSRVICCKSLKPEFAGDALAQRRFVREARVTAMLQHPNTIPTYELGRNSQGHCYFTMKLVHGSTLREVLDSRARYDLPRLVGVVVQVAHALDYAHGHGVVHRDIKPENVLVGPFGEVLLMDWGLAKVLGPGDDDLAAAEAAGPLEGTVCYMSPEQIDEAPDLDHRTDIYSLGAVLYEVLCGQPPVGGTTLDEILRQTQSGDITPPGQVAQRGEGNGTGVPEHLEAICMACLRLAPAERMQTAAALIRALQENG